MGVDITHHTNPNNRNLTMFNLSMLSMLGGWGGGIQGGEVVSPPYVCNQP